MGSPGLATVPVVNFLAGLIFRVAVSLLQTALELFLLPCDDIQIIVGQLAPLLFDLALYFLPVAFNSIPIPRRSPFGRRSQNQTRQRSFLSRPATN
jgi:hypothetical protein